MEKVKKRMLNPILKKELRLGARSIKLPLSVMFYDIVLSIIAVISIFITSYANVLENGGVDFSGFLYIFQVIGWTQLGITLLIVPILSAGTISGEREKQTLEIMLTTPKKPLAIIWGKLLAALSQFMIFIISSVPIMAIAFVLGGLNWFALLGYILMMIILAIYVGSIGVFCSSTFKKTIASVVMTFLIEFALLAIPIIAFFMIIAIGAVIHESIYYNLGVNYAGIPDPNFGILPLIMIVTPLTGFFDYMMRSMDVFSLAEILKEADVFGTIMPIIAHAWIPLNIIVCGGISYFFLRMAARNLNPVKKLKRKKSKASVMQVPPMQGQMMPPPVPGQAGISHKEPPQLYHPQQPQPQVEPVQNPGVSVQPQEEPVQNQGVPVQPSVQTEITERLVQPDVESGL